MAKIFLVLSLIASLAAGYFAWQTIQKTQEVQKNLTKTQNTLKDTQTQLSKTKDQLKDTQDQLTATKTQLDAKIAENQTLQTKIDEQTKTIADTQAQLTQAQTDLKAAQDELAALKPAKAGDVKSAIQQKIDDLTAQLAEKDTLLKAAQAKADEAEQRATAMAEKESKRQALLNKPGIEGQVLAVNQGWNFAVISIGDKQGSMANAEVLVKRGDTLIAKMKVTTVEPSTSIADIETETLAKGQRVMPGDRVIFTGQSIKAQ